MAVSSTRTRAASGYGAIGQTDLGSGSSIPMIGGRRRKPGLRAREAAIPYEMEHRLFAIGKGYAWHLSRASPLLDARGAVVRWYGTTTDIDDQKHREANIRDLMAEVNHRRAICSRSRRPSRAPASRTRRRFDEFQARYSERLLGLAASQDLLTDRNWRGVPLEALVRAQTARCPEALCERRAAGAVEPKCNTDAWPCFARSCATTLSSTAPSRELKAMFSVHWRIAESEAEPKLEMIWRERGESFCVNRGGELRVRQELLSSVLPPQVSTLRRY